MNYVNTFIEVAEDCKAEAGLEPKARASGKTVAEIEYELVAQKPYTYTQEDVQFHVHATRKAIPAHDLALHEAELRQAFFSQPMACMRTSPLAKTHGWGLHFNEAGLLGLVSRDSARYQELARDPKITHTRALRSKRA